jgi:hypothetical protein
LPKDHAAGHDVFFAGDRPFLICHEEDIVQIDVGGVADRIPNRLYAIGCKVEVFFFCATASGAQKSSATAKSALVAMTPFVTTPPLWSWVHQQHD